MYPPDLVTKTPANLMQLSVDSSKLAINSKNFLFSFKQ